MNFKLTITLRKAILVSSIVGMMFMHILAIVLMGKGLEVFTGDDGVLFVGGLTVMSLYMYYMSSSYGCRLVVKYYKRENEL